MIHNIRCCWLRVRVRLLPKRGSCVGCVAQGACMRDCTRGERGHAVQLCCAGFAWCERHHVLVREWRAVLRPKVLHRLRGQSNIQQDEDPGSLRPRGGGGTCAWQSEAHRPRWQHRASRRNHQVAWVQHREKREGPTYLAAIRAVCMCKCQQGQPTPERWGRGGEAARWVAPVFQSSPEGTPSATVGRACAWAHATSPCWRSSSDGAVTAPASAASALMASTTASTPVVAIVAARAGRGCGGVAGGERRARGISSTSSTSQHKLAC